MNRLDRKLGWKGSLFVALFSLIFATIEIFSFNFLAACGFLMSFLGWGFATMTERELDRVYGAASDYLLGEKNDGFANEFGGIDALRHKLAGKVKKWEGNNES